jgi:5-(carboxyamino)imidazole ribonucleotide synthase
MRIGIMGGGQLGLYLCQAAKELGLTTVVLNPEADCSAAAVADSLLVGGLDDVSAADRLAADVDLVTFEIESVAPAVLEHLANLARDRGLRVYPDPQIMLTLQNKVLQKEWLRRHGFPSSDHVVLHGGVPDTAALVARFGLPFVQKAAFGGYDGRGVQIIRTEADLAGLWTGPSLIEAFVAHDQEIAVLTARGADGAVVSYPPAGLRFNVGANVLETVVCPATLPEAVARRATDLAERIVAALDGVGLFAAEMFVTGEDEVLVNEISPRVHNAGHLTIEGFETSQFAQHLRAVAGLPLGSVAQVRPAAMRNILYTADLDLPTGPAHVVPGTGSESGDRASSVFVHWYGKKGAKALRKVGHITALAVDGDAAEHDVQAALRALSRGARP